MNIKTFLLALFLALSTPYGEIADEMGITETELLNDISEGSTIVIDNHTGEYVIDVQGPLESVQRGPGDHTVTLDDGTLVPVNGPGDFTVVIVDDL